MARQRRRAIAKVKPELEAATSETMTDAPCSANSRAGAPDARGGARNQRHLAAKPLLRHILMSPSSLITARSVLTPMDASRAGDHLPITPSCWRRRRRMS
jgi:hypothetical protein